MIRFPFHPFLTITIMIVLWITSGCNKEQILISLQPESGSTCKNRIIDLSIVASCSSEVHYQWQQLIGSSWVEVGIDSQSYRTDSLEKTSAYRVKVFSLDGECKQMYSDVAVVKVIDCLERITGDYTGICYIEKKSFNNMTLEVIFEFDTVNSEINVHMSGMSNTTYTIEVGNSPPVSTFYMYPEQFLEDTINEFSHWSTRSQSVQWIPSEKEMITYYRDEGLLPNYYFRRQCFYLKI